MKRWIQVSALAVALTFTVGLGAVSAADHKLPNCPVMDEPIDFSVSTPSKEGPVYFCCKGCIKKFRDNPSKYEKGLVAQRAALAKLPKIQVTCPIKGGAIVKDAYAEKDGKKVYFCCKGCISKFNDHPEKYKAALAASYTYQTQCPVMDEEINPTVSDVLPDGKRVYYCCKGCNKKLLADPGKYAAKLAAQGTNINVAKIKEAAAHEGHDHEGHGHEGHDHGDGGGH